MTVRMASISIMSGLDCRKVEYWVGSESMGSEKKYGEQFCEDAHSLSQVISVKSKRIKSL